MCEHLGSLRRCLPATLDYQLLTSKTRLSGLGNLTPTRPLQDRRRAERLQYSGRIAVTWAEGTFQAYSANLSETGVFIETTDSLPLGSSVRLDFKVSGAAQRQSVRAEGRVVRHVTTDEAAARGLPPGFGVLFERVPEGETALFEFMSERLRDIREPQAAAIEARRDPRTLVAFPVFWGMDRQLGREGSLQNLSVSGAFLETPAPEPLGTHLYLWFELPSEGVVQSVRATAVVAYVQPAGGRRAPGMGIAFETSIASTAIVERFIEARLGSAAVSESEPTPDPSELEPELGDTEATSAPLIRLGRFPRGRRLALLILLGVLMGLLVSLILL